MKEIFSFILVSLELDAKFIRLAPFTLVEKLHFIVIKYFLILKHMIRSFVLGEDYVVFRGEKIYYDSKYGIAGYQRVLSSHTNFLGIAGVTSATTIVDIGANVGYFSKLMRELYPKSNIYSFEPIPVTFDCLKKNFRGDSSIKLSNLAISDRADTTRMNFDSSKSSLSMINPNGSIMVESTTLDMFVTMEGIDHIDILKIDTETFELHVLRGARKSLSITKYLFIEATLENNDNYTFASLMRSLSSDLFDFQLVALRNFTGKAEGEAIVLDFLMENVILSGKENNECE